MDQPPQPPILPQSTVPPADRFLHRALRWAVNVRPREVRALLWSWLYIFCLFWSYSMLRPIRDDMGVAGGVDKLQWLFTATLVAMILVNPAFAALVSRLPRARFISLSYHFFAANLLIFAILLRFATAQQDVWIGRAFYVWVSVFNLFVVSVFWALMVDLFTSEQGKRLFGFIAAGTTLGGIVGSAATAALAPRVPAMALLAGSALLLELAVFAVWRLTRISERLLARHGVPRDNREPVGGGVLAGITQTLRSPYLLSISLYMLLYTITSTFLYFQQADIAQRHFPDRGARTSFFAQVELLVQVLTLLTQVFLTGRILRALGVALTLTLLPALSMIGFGAVSLVPSIALLVGFLVLRRAGNFSLARPTREVLFTVLDREDKYKAKNFIDTVVYRTGDQVGAWSTVLIRWLGMGMTGVAVVAVPVSLAWLLNALWVGRRHERAAGTVPATQPQAAFPVIVPPAQR